MTETKVKPQRKQKVELREPAKPLAQPESRALPDDHPMAGLVRPALLAQNTPANQPTTNQPPPTHQPIAPERNYARVPNSVALRAIPAGEFKGESLKTYQALYQRTRGAVVARRAIRATRAEVMEWARISHNTLKSHLKHLERRGLVVVHYKRGDNDGADYEVFTPEEVTPPTNQPSTNYPPITSQNLDTPTSQNLVVGGGGQPLKESTVSKNTKTFLNTKDRSDDEAFAELRKLERELTGKSTANWSELDKVLAAELRIAAARTTVSNVPAFLAEHLRRRLWKLDKKQAAAEGRELPDQAAASAPAVSRQDCPDCKGSGWWYPQGQDNGVAKCRHENLK